jgi:NADH:ubiquinone oxidoreductase subunit H
MSALLPFWATLVLALGTMMLGLNQSSVPGWFGGVRIASQALSGAFPAMIALICAGLTCHTFRWSDLVAAQGFSPFRWNAFSQPFGFMAFLVFISSGLVIIGIPPLDGGASVQDIHGGVASHLFGRKLILFRLGRFYAFFLWALITTVLFMGGWSLPQGFPEAIGKDLLPWVEFSVLLAKTLMVLVSVVLVARATPRLRSDQVTDFAWKVLSPLALVALSGSTLWLGWAMLRSSAG